jgi:hypothetical protein
MALPVLALPAFSGREALAEAVASLSGKTDFAALCSASLR